MTPTLQFLGAAQTVTGSRFLFDANGQQVLVDAGLFQGARALRDRNWAPLPIGPRAIETVVLTHGHIDHIGYLPRLVHQGFAGPVYCTPATKELADLMLPDAARLQEEEAEYANREQYTNHRPALPLYTVADAERALRLFRTVEYETTIEAARGITISFRPTGHILGAAFVEVVAEGRRVIFSGDLGGYDSAVMVPPAPLPANFDYILVESTYGDRVEDFAPVEDQLAGAIAPALAAGGVVVIPAFAVGRTTLVLYHLRKLMDQHRLPSVPVYLDSPLATDAVDLYCRFGADHNLAIDLLKDGAACPIRTPNIHITRTVDESKRLNQMRGPAIIVSANGMASGGRVLHHLKRRLPYGENLVLLVGYQAVGTRGRQLQDGAKYIRIHGQDVAVAARVAAIHGLSAHGDCGEVVRWLKTAPTKPKKAFLVHGEPDSLESFGKRVRAELGWDVAAPNYLEKVELT